MTHSKYVNIPVDRRTFLKNTTLATAGLTTYLSSMPVMGREHGRDDLLLHERFFPIAAINDTINLLQLEGQLSGVLKNAMDGWQNVARMGGLGARRAGSLSAFATRLKSNGSGEKNARQAALILGAAMFTGIEETLTSLYPGVKQTNKAEDAGLKAIYHDVAVLKGISEGSKGPIKLNSVSEEEMISLFEIMWHRSLIKLHTIKPDLEDTRAWILRFTDFGNNQKEVYKAYAQAYLKKNPDLYDKYITRPNVYNTNDELLTILRSPEKKLFRSTAGNLKKILAQKEGVSVYTKAILKAYSHAHRLNDFWKGKHNKDEIAAIFGA